MQYLITLYPLMILQANWYNIHTIKVKYLSCRIKSAHAQAE